jgi:hypothetical protein
VFPGNIFDVGWTTRRSQMALAIVMMLVVLSAPASAGDPFIGEWKMNPSKSEFNGRSVPESGMVRFESEVDGLRHTIEWADAEGRGVRNTFRAKFDGKDYPALSSGQTVSRKRLAPNTFEAIFKKNGKLANRDRWEVSADGRTLILTSAGVDATTGKPYKMTAIFERQ